MASRVEEPAGVDAQGYHKNGFSSFASQLPGKLRQKPVQKKTLNQQVPPMVTRLRGIKERKPAISLPHIHVNKLQERIPKRLTQSLKCDNEMLAHIDCKFCKDGTKKRLIPSLIPSSMLPKLGGEVYQASSGWGWSRKEYRIRQTKFSSGETGGMCEDCWGLWELIKQIRMHCVSVSSTCMQPDIMITGFVIN